VSVECRGFLCSAMLYEAWLMALRRALYNCLNSMTFPALAP